MNFFKILFFFTLLLMPTISFSDNHDQKKEVLEQVKEIAKEMEDDEEAMLSEVFNTKENSRLSCQIPITENLNNLEIEIANEI